jgi:hypothetical protein
MCYRRLNFFWQDYISLFFFVITSEFKSQSNSSENSNFKAAFIAYKSFRRNRV